MKPTKTALAIEATNRLADYCLEHGANPEGVKDDLSIIQDPIRKYQTLENGHCSTTILENEGSEVPLYPISCEQIWVSSRGWFSTSVFTPPEHEKDLWRKYTIGGDAV